MSCAFFLFSYKIQNSPLSHWYYLINWVWIKKYQTCQEGSSLILTNCLQVSSSIPYFSQGDCPLRFPYTYLVVKTVLYSSLRNHHTEHALVSTQYLVLYIYTIHTRTIIFVIYSYSIPLSKLYKLFNTVLILITNSTCSYPTSIHDYIQKRHHTY